MVGDAAGEVFLLVSPRHPARVVLPAWKRTTPVPGNLHSSHHGGVLLVESAKLLAREFLQGMGPRWSHVVAVGQAMERIAGESELVTPVLVSAAWLHDVGYSPDLVETGSHAIDGARALNRLEAPDELVALVAHHTGACFEAEERGLSNVWAGLPTPRQVDLDVLNLVDLSTSPTGQPMRVGDRIAEILERYKRGHPVHRAVTRSRHELAASAARARHALELPDDWPFVASESVSNPESHRGMEF